MSDQPDLPALSDDELRETLDLLGTVIASVSDRVDSQGVLLDRLTKTAAETRQAAFAARSQTDPALYGEIIAEKINEKLARPFQLISQAGLLLDKSTGEAVAALKQAEDDKFVLLREVRERETKAERLKHRLPWFATGAAVLALVLTVTLPRFYASNAATCAVIGAEWTRTTTGVDACVFYAE